MYQTRDYGTYEEVGLKRTNDILHDMGQRERLLQVDVLDYAN